MKHLKTIILIFLLLVFIVGCKGQNKVEEKTVKSGSIVTFDYAAGFDNGTLFDTSIEDAAKKAGIFSQNRLYQPEKVIIGKSPLVPGLEEALIGMKEGEIKNARIPPEKAYGALIENSTIILKKSRINSSETLKINDPLVIENTKGQKIFTFVKNINNENVTVNLNHPLAGKYIHFSVLIRKIE